MMVLESVNPATGQRLAQLAVWDEQALASCLAQTAQATPAWAALPLEARCALLQRVAEVLEARQDELARLTTLEMGKLIIEARAEIAKCALVCRYYAEQGSDLLSDEMVPSDAARSYIAYQPLGTVLAVMPWNFPFWQVFRFAAPALVAGNTAVLKHAANVPQCGRAIESVFHEAGLPVGVFSTLMITASQVRRVIEDPCIQAVTLTGSEQAGRQVAAGAGECLKKTVLELGGSDPFIVLEDADLDVAVPQAVKTRFLNAGQSCIAAKRFIVVAEIAEAFLARFQTAVEALQAGDPQDETTTLAPMARQDLRIELHRQVQDSIAAGAVVVTGCVPLPGEGAYYAASILDQVTAGMPAWEEELFGPVASVIRVADEQETVAVANGSRFGLGASVWTADQARGEGIARQLQAGAVFVNGMVKSDPRLPFGGIKASGYGRELARQGLHEFLNVKTVWIG